MFSSQLKLLLYVIFVVVVVNRQLCAQNSKADYIALWSGDERRRNQERLENELQVIVRNKNVSEDWRFGILALKLGNLGSVRAADFLAGSIDRRPSSLHPRPEGEDAPYDVFPAAAGRHR